MRKLFLLGLLVALGCRPHHQPAHIVLLIDTSSSIGSDVSRMESAAAGVAERLKGGDEISVLAICDGAYSARSTPLHLAVSDKREAFDEEIARFRKAFRGGVQALLSGEQCQRTAILDTIERAASMPGNDRVYILTDGIEDSGINFYRDPRVGSLVHAEQLAKTLSATRQKMTGAKVRLGLIESTDFDQLSRQRQDGIVAFWKTYLSELSKDSQVESPELWRD